MTWKISNHNSQASSAARRRGSEQNQHAGARQQISVRNPPVHKLDGCVIADEHEMTHAQPRRMTVVDERWSDADIR